MYATRCVILKQNFYPDHNDAQEKRALAKQITKLKVVGKQFKVRIPMYGYARTATVEQYSDSDVHLKYTCGAREISTWTDLLPRLQVSTVSKYNFAIKVMASL